VVDEGGSGRYDTFKQKRKKDTDPSHIAQQHKRKKVVLTFFVIDSETKNFTQKFYGFLWCSQKNLAFYGFLWCFMAFMVFMALWNNSSGEAAAAAAATTQRQQQSSR
jgi:hypothetical protein